jgi:hypothetical protein
MTELGFKIEPAGLDGRSNGMGFTRIVATVSLIGEPGNADMGFTTVLAGLDGRTRQMDFKASLATVLHCHAASSIGGGGVVLSSRAIRAAAA